MSRRAELLGVFGERRTDVVPVSTYGVDRYSHPWMADDPSFARVLAASDQYENILAFNESYYASFGVTNALGVSDPAALAVQAWRSDGATHTRYTLRTPHGDLHANYTENDGIRTVWRHDPLIKTDADIRAFLAAPLAPGEPDFAAFERRHAALGEKGLTEIELPNALCLVVENLPYEDFMARTIQTPDLIEALLDKMNEVLLGWLARVLELGMGPVFRIFGPEYAAPPMMSPRFFRRAVVERDRPIIDMIHRAGGFARYHCHGPVRRILDDVLALGVDALDPCEAPPGGDITLRELADRVGRDLVLMGNVQLDDIERADAETIDRLVGEALDEVGGRAPFILCTTAFSFQQPLPEVTERNLIQFLESAHARRRAGILSGVRPVGPDEVEGAKI